MVIARIWTETTSARRQLSPPLNGALPLSARDLGAAVQSPKESERLHRRDLSVPAPQNEQPPRAEDGHQQREDDGHRHEGCLDGIERPGREDSIGYLLP